VHGRGVTKSKTLKSATRNEEKEKKSAPIERRVNHPGARAKVSNHAARRPAPPQAGAPTSVAFAPTAFF